MVGSPELPQDLATLDDRRLIGLVIRDFQAIVLPAVPDGMARSTGAILLKLLQLLEARGTVSGLAEAVSEAGAALDLAAPGPEFRLALVSLAEARSRLALGGLPISLADSFAEAAGGGVQRPEIQPIEPTKLTAAALCRHLARSGAYGSPIEIEAFREVGTGNQKAIFFATLRSPDGLFDVALRQDKPVSSLGVSVVDEFALLQALDRAGLPVARPIWCAERGPDTGSAVYATERLPGSANYTLWSGDAAVALPIVREAALWLARLHAIDIGTLPQARQPLPGSVGDTPAERVMHLAAFWRGVGYAEPVVDLCLDWLRTEAPPRFARQALVHGDFAFHNFLIDDGRLTGVLDWEFAHPGDPIEDLVYIRPFVEPLGCWPQFLAAYQAAGGGPFDPEAGRYWAVFGMLRLVIGAFNNVRMVRDGIPGLDIRVASSGCLYAGELLVAVTRLIAES
jgi:aminoglycoside phosphotransferase (APT) family kinase protein